MVEAVVSGRDVLAVMPTGAGKSLCYQLPALLVEGTTLVVSPLIALMKDQVDALAARGHEATFINSSLAPEEQGERIRALGEGRLRLLYVAPERFRQRSFVAALSGARVARFAVDEAHCISQWGHDFRPDYRRLGQALDRLGRPPVAAFTATATPEVRQDIARELALRDPAEFLAGFERPELYLEVTPAGGAADKLARLERLMAPGESGIVYAATRRNVEDIAAHFHGRLLAYHAGMADAERSRVQEAFMTRTAAVVAATNAFGMGIDRADLRFVIHYDVPRSLEAYYQEAGRAGRDGGPARCTLLFHHGDVAIQEFLIAGNHPSREVVRETWRALWEDPASVVERPVQDLARSVASADNEMSVGSALRVLEENGLVERGHRGANPARVRRRASPAEVGRALGERLTQRRLVVEALERAHGEALDEGVEVHPAWLARRTGLAEEAVRRALAALAEAGLLDYRPPFSGRSVVKTTPWIPEAELPVDWAALDERARRELDRLQRMVDYAYHRGCRRRPILDYFTGRRTRGRCGRCDGCERASRRAAPLDAQATATVRTVLELVRRVDGRYGRTRLAQALVGSAAAGAAAMERVAGFGALEGWRRERALELLDRLVQAGYLRITGEGRYPVVALTPEGRSVLRGTRAARVAVPRSA
ncbi:MAG: RecQ family ATP-dependent DNA helicase [Planctomycetes bacterium]|nr:RecQ family ATP-dependent DNA helicase [Planctomycetota bacterium]